MERNACLFLLMRISVSYTHLDVYKRQQYCNGTTTTCDGLSQWGTVSLAEQGMIAYEILQYYYGDDIEIVFDAPVGPNVESYPGIPLRRGSAGEDVRTIQRQLNRIGRNYPSIPRIENTNGIFGEQTQDAVRTFQGIFNLTQDGICLLYTSRPQARAGCGAMHRLAGR